MLGREGLSIASSCLVVPSSLSLPEICNWLAAQLMLSRLACARDRSLGPTRLFGGDRDMTPGAAGD